MRESVVQRTARSAAALFMAFPGCATAGREDEDRRAYVLARPHAWVEISIADVAIPDVPVTQKDGTIAWEAPSACSFSVRMNGEPWLADALHPQGAVAPYFVQSGYRFPVPAGVVKLRIGYGGCRVEAGKEVAVDLETAILASENLVYDVVFVGDRVDLGPPRPDTVVSLEDVYQAITGRRAPQD